MSAADRSATSLPRTLAIVAATLGVLALVAGVSDGASGRRIDVAQLARTVKNEEGG